MRLTRKTQLKLASEVQLSLVGGDLRVYAGHRELRCSREQLRVLAAFIEPQPLEEALDEIAGKSKTGHEWAELTALVYQLIDIGVLSADERMASVVADDWRSFAAPGVHIAMLEDRIRTGSFVEAIKRAIRPDDVVLDIGTGTGVLALAAAQAGARRVYAIERSSIADTAASVFRRAGVEDRIVLIRGNSTQVELPERADVLVSEIIGGEPLAERVLEVTADAIARHLQPSARLIPRSLRVFAQAVKVDDQLLASHVFERARVEDWSERYGLDLSGVLDGTTDAVRRFHVSPSEAAGWELLTPPVVLADVDLSAPPRSLDQHAELTVTKKGRLDGAVVFFELGVDQEHVISTEPVRSDPTCSWRVAVYVLSERTLASVGDRIALRYRHTLARTTLAIERLS